MASLRDLEKDALRLSKKERAILVENLILSLDDDEQVLRTEEELIEEAERRYQELKDGKVKGITAGEVFRKIKSRFK